MPKPPPVPLQTILRAAEEAFSGLPLEIEDPSDEELETGNRRFSYSEDDWTVRGLARLDDDGPKLLNLLIVPSGGAVVSATMVRNIPVGKITASLRTLLTLDRARRGGVLGEGAVAAAAATTLTISYGRTLPGLGAYLTTNVVPAPAEQAEVRERRGGKPAVTDALLRSVAEAYLEETGEGKPPRPLARVAARFDRPEETVRTWLSRARKSGWLAPGTQGRAGGEPGPKLLAAWVEEHAEQ